jgi:hypothetical protein
MDLRPLPDDLLETTAQTRFLWSALTPERWALLRARAEERVRTLAAVAEEWERTGRRRHALETVAPTVHWSTYLNWCRCAANRSGAAWERQLDVRVPPPPVVVPANVRSSACTLRLLVPGMSYDAARERLIAQFGKEKGGISDASLKRIWKEGGLARSRGRQGAPQEDVVRLSGGAGLAFLAAAAAETGIVAELGAAVEAHVAAAVAAAETRAAVGGVGDFPVGGHAIAEIPSDPSVTREAEAVATTFSGDGRDARGQFTASYNRAARGTGARDPRRDSEERKRARRSVEDLRLAGSSAAVIGWKILAIGAAPLLTERRGFDGLDGPTGDWLAALGGHAYQPATLDKMLAELAFVDAGGVLWSTHGEHWARTTLPWRTSTDAPPWQRWVVYVDATQDPYWTHAYAVSGKVSRVNKVMPCLTRVAMTGGPGVPLAVETHAGSVSLKKELVPFLDRMEGVLGDGELGRLTIMDAEMATRPLMTELAARPDRWFITVLKGGTAKAARKADAATWERYRERDLIREISIRFGGDERAEGDMTLRGIEMIREGSRNPTTTTFATNAPATELSSSQAVDAYLSRWPHQEQRFRNARNGLGMDRAHGYGGEEVTHVAFTTALEKAEGRVERAGHQVARVEASEANARVLLEGASAQQRGAARAAVRSAERETAATRRKQREAVAEQQRQSTKPREIYLRDTTRDGIVTSAKLTVLMLMEYALKEYFGGLRMEVRTFIESFVNLPVTIRRTQTETLYEIQENGRNPRSMTQLRSACAEVNGRTLSADGRSLRFCVTPRQLV